MAKSTVWEILILPLMVVNPNYYMLAGCYKTRMADRLIRAPDERTGPAALDREPIVLPEQRKQAVNRVRDILSSR